MFHATQSYNWMLLGLLLAFFDQEFVLYWGLSNGVLVILAICARMPQIASRTIAGYMMGCALFALNLKGENSDLLLSGFVCGEFVQSHLLSFLLGSMMTTQLIAKYIYDVDLRTVGSGNLGITNMLRSGKVSLLTVVLVACFELLKAWYVTRIGGYSALMWCVAGNVFSPWTADGKGGKGLVNFLGGAICLAPAAGSLSALCWASGTRFAPARYTFLVSVVAFVFAMSGCVFNAHSASEYMALMVTGLVIAIAHHKNLKNLFSVSSNNLTAIQDSAS